MGGNRIQARSVTKVNNWAIGWNILCWALQKAHRWATKFITVMDMNMSLSKIKITINLWLTNLPTAVWPNVWHHVWHDEIGACVPQVSGPRYRRSPGSGTWPREGPLGFWQAPLQLCFPPANPRAPTVCFQCLSLSFTWVSQAQWRTEDRIPPSSSWPPSHLTARILKKAVRGLEVLKDLKSY